MSVPPGSWTMSGCPTVHVDPRVEGSEMDRNGPKWTSSPFPMRWLSLTALVRPAKKVFCGVSLETLSKDYRGSGGLRRLSCVVPIHIATFPRHLCVSMIWFWPEWLPRHRA